MRMGDRVALMRRSRVVQTGGAPDLYRVPNDIFAHSRTSTTYRHASRTALPGRCSGTSPPMVWLKALTPSSACVNAAYVSWPSAKGVPARVPDAHFLAEVALMEIAVQGLDAPLLRAQGKATRRRSGPRSAIDTGAVLVFEAEVQAAANTGGEPLPASCDAALFAAIVLRTTRL
jgi:iron(III) transport system ATP-binding protein